MLPALAVGVIVTRDTCVSIEGHCFAGEIR